MNFILNFYDQFNFLSEITHEPAENFLDTLAFANYISTVKRPEKTKEWKHYFPNLTKIGKTYAPMQYNSNAPFLDLVQNLGQGSCMVSSINIYFKHRIFDSIDQFNNQQSNKSNISKKLYFFKFFKNYFI